MIAEIELRFAAAEDRMHEQAAASVRIALQTSKSTDAGIEQAIRSGRLSETDLEDLRRGRENMRIVLDRLIDLENEHVERVVHQTMGTSNAAPRANPWLAPIIWGVASILYFKLAFDAAFPRDITIVAVVALGCILVLTIFLSAKHYAIQLGRHMARVVMGQHSAFAVNSFLVLSTAAGAYVVVGWLIIIAFSKKLARYIDFGYSTRTEHVFTAIALLLVPLVVHYVSILVAANVSTGRLDDRRE